MNLPQTHERALAATVDAIAAIVAPQIDMLNGSGMFGTTVGVGPGADAQTRLLALLGRTS